MNRGFGALHPDSRDVARATTRAEAVRGLEGYVTALGGPHATPLLELVRGPRLGADDRDRAERLFTDVVAESGILVRPGNSEQLAWMCGALDRLTRD